MIIKNLKILFAIFLFCILYISYYCIDYFLYYKNSIKNIKSCEQSQDDYWDEKCEKDSCYIKMYNLLLPKLLTYSAKINSQPIKTRMYYPCYVLSDIALEKADALIGYGVFFDALAEEQFVYEYDKPAYAFDCGIPFFKTRHKKCIFESSCIGTDDFILKEENQNSSGNIHSFGQKLKELGFENKKVFIKMDIAGAETEVLPDILKYSDNITGMSITFRLTDTKKIIKSFDILDSINEDFILIARANHFSENHKEKKSKYLNGEIPAVIVLSYINKNLIDEYSLNWVDKPIINDNIDKNNIHTVPKGIIKKQIILLERIKK